VTSAAWSSDSSALFLAHGNDVEIYAYNNETNKYEEALKLQDHNDTVQAVVLSRDDKWLASAGNSQHLVIYNWNGTDYVKFADKKPVDSAIQGLSITADGGLISSSYVADQQSQNSLVYQYGIDCSGDTHSIGRATPTSCNCANHFVWNTTQSVCYVDCASDKHSTGTSTDFETCGCNDMFEWNNSTSLCEVPCDRDPNSNGTNSDA
jgi:WD40 repeat protein